MDENKTNQVSNLAMQLFFTQMLCFLSLIINICTITVCLFTDFSNASKTGLLLAYAFMMDSDVKSYVQDFSKLEQQMVSFERCRTYMQLDSEDGYKKIVEGILWKPKIGDTITFPPEELQDWPV